MSRSDLENARRIEEHGRHNKCRLKGKITRTVVSENGKHMHLFVYPRPKRGALAFQQAGIVILMLKEVIGTTILHITEIDTKRHQPPSVSRRVIFHLLICLVCGHVWEHTWFSRKAVENEEGDEVLTSTMSKIS